MRVLIVTAMYPTADNPAFGSFVKTQVQALKAAGIQVELWVLGGRWRKGIYPKAVLQIHRRLAERPVDLVHAHYGLVGMVARLQWQAPLIVTFHGDDLLGTVDEHGQHTTISRLIAAGGRLLCRYADAAIVQSPEMAAKIEGSCKVYILPHEIDFDIFRPTEKAEARRILGLDPAKKYLLFAANPAIPVKRFPLAKAAAEKLARLEPAVELLVVYKETQQRLALYMSGADALIFPSYQEGSPNIVKQAMACNLPIVATDVGDVRQVIASTRLCYLCAPTVDDFAAKFECILQDGGRSDGRVKVAHLNGPRIARRLSRIYHEVAAGRTGVAVAEAH